MKTSSFNGLSKLFSLHVVSDGVWGSASGIGVTWYQSRGVALPKIKCSNCGVLVNHLILVMCGKLKKKSGKVNVAFIWFWQSLGNWKKSQAHMYSKCGILINYLILEFNDRDGKQSWVSWQWRNIVSFHASCLRLLLLLCSVIIMAFIFLRN